MILSERICGSIFECPVFAAEDGKGEEPGEILKSGRINDRRTTCTLKSLCTAWPTSILSFRRSETRLWTSSKGFAKEQSMS